MLRTAIVGLGWWGQVLVDSVQAKGKPKGDKIHFTTGVVRNQASSAEYAARQDLILSTEYKTVLENPDIDAVVLATPHGLHESAVVQAIQARKHVFVEKPLTLNSHGAKRIQHDAENSDIILALGHNRRFLPAVLTMKDMVSTGVLGTLLHTEGNFSNRYGFEYSDQNWRANKIESPAGGMTAGGIHMLDTFIYLFGTLTRVQSLSLRRVIKVPMDDTTSMLLRFSSGMSGYLGTITTTARNWSLYAYGTKGWVHMRDNEVLDICLVDGEVETRTFKQVDIERAELEAFSDAVAGKMEYPVPLEDVVHGISTLEAITTSAERNGDAIEVGV